MSEVPRVERALADARDALTGASRTDCEDALRDLVEAIDHARGTIHGKASRLLRAALDGDEDCRETAIEDAIDLARCVWASSPGEALELMGSREASELLGVKTPNLRKLAGLPAPLAELKSGPVWDGSAIRALAERRRGEEV